LQNLIVFFDGFSHQQVPPAAISPAISIFREKRLENILLYRNIPANFSPGNLKFLCVTCQQPDLHLLLSGSAEKWQTIRRGFRFKCLKHSRFVFAVCIHEKEDQVEMPVSFQDLRQLLPSMFVTLYFRIR